MTWEGDETWQNLRISKPMVPIKLNSESLLQMVTRLTIERNAARIDADRLRQYARHDPICQGLICICGLNDALAFHDDLVTKR